MSLNSASALQKLFVIPPFTLLLQGTHCKVEVEPTRVRVRDDIEFKMQTFETDSSVLDQMIRLLDQVLLAGDTLDVAVNGREFAITRGCNVHIDGISGSTYGVIARHRLIKDDSAKFKASLVATV